ncbi:MAG: hypothetical protein KGY61_12525 [Desulfobacterales bacterium]|nr:hypothetical protein [Desulfobacterales bacterium]
MASVLKSSPKISQFPLKAYHFEISIDRLKRGIDNVRHDVHISPDFHRMTNRLVFQLILYYAEVSPIFHTESQFHWHNEISEFKRLCHAILQHGINTAKSSREIQIDILAQISVVKLLTEDIAHQFDEAVQHLKTVIRKQELAQPMEPPVTLREEVSAVIQRKDQIIQSVGSDIFQYFIEVQHELNKLRISNFGEKSIIPKEILSNPILQSTGQINGFFLIENYVLIGHRIEDPINYNALFNLLMNFLAEHLGESLDKGQSAMPASGKGHGTKPEITNMTDAYRPEIDGIIKYVSNIDLLFNFFKTKETLKKQKKQQAASGHLRKLKNRANDQKKLLDLFFRRITNELMINGIVAPYMMAPIVKEYCPPLSAQECLQYLVIPKARKTIVQKLNRFKRYYSQSFSLYELDQTVQKIKHTSKRRQQRYLIRFLTDFARYHRDLINYQVVKDTADSINIRSEEKSIRLSRENQSLYEFILSHEQEAEARQIQNHSVVKADIRGSSKIIDQMKEKQQNPATSFSLNFFDPINNILALYGAQKIFIEGDAVILSIFEHEDVPGEWYAVSRACGLAINMLLIVSRYNLRNRINRLPMLDIGIGIGFAGHAPTFFYDNDNQIMISPAINIADRLSECHKSLRRKLRKQKPPFNVYRYKPSPDGIPESVPLPTGFLRYNVKGIELHESGFKKLANEIHLEQVNCRIPELSTDPIALYTGKFPTMAGRYQRLVIREALIPEVSLNDLQIIRYTDQKYYEVCTNSQVYTYVKKHLKE